MNDHNHLHKYIRIIPIIGLLFFLVLIIYAYQHGIFRSTTSLQRFIQQFGEYAVVIFILLQIIQVIIPILPGGISSVAGLLMFGNGWGLLYSCIGLIIGEAIGFLLVRYYGVSFVQLILSPKKYQKFDQLLTQKTKDIKKVLCLTMLIPFAPDDLVCLVAGLTKISFKEYIQIVLLLKPWSVGAYSLIMLYLFQKAQGNF
ncbi:TVP38/TMEM64 family protein [Enterococcus hirae]|uniref:TVP38/TMEM64 family membrane protein n=1 Tax=Enterococcus hirae TaxID=1354 RepID=A0AB37I8H1_ENTHR|nr:TVP38/TMEM64 family protein [Enterococcus hirae]HCU82256.1 TVP38/TMEM64 family protein [Enterococcus sp.]EMF0035825.1 TVP38/TMEM64 family protein [Enterococcus hirae]EMF0047044.1 TVP38/TMEM64 family protein [Enterococcus hirae]EMF0058932.1 TVP38/TMEM64 family protein [Enterococcus hirae]EMF0079183.1 TVP38/TMEM64 family protein [Enterococcus hirae]